MADQSTTSFIPKRAAEKPQVRRSSLSLLSLLAVVIFVLALLGSGGVFLYQRFLDSSLEEKRQELERAREAFEPELIEELAHLDARLTQAQTILDTHIAPSRLFETLEDTTLQDVQFTRFSYGVGTSEAGGITLQLEGEARSFAAVALQSDAFNKDPRIINPIFSNLGVASNGNVTFAVTAEVNSSAVAYIPQTSVSVSVPAQEDGVGVGTSTNPTTTEPVAGETPTGGQ